APRLSRYSPVRPPPAPACFPYATLFRSRWAGRRRCRRRRSRTGPRRGRPPRAAAAPPPGCGGPAAVRAAGGRARRCGRRAARAAVRRRRSRRAPFGFSHAARGPRRSAGRSPSSPRAGPLAASLPGLLPVRGGQLLPLVEPLLPHDPARPEQHRHLGEPCAAAVREAFELEAVAHQLQARGGLLAEAGPEVAAVVLADGD